MSGILVAHLFVAGLLRIPIRISNLCLQNPFDIFQILFSSPKAASSQINFFPHMVSPFFYVFLPFHGTYPHTLTYFAMMSFTLCIIIITLYTNSIHQHYLKLPTPYITFVELARGNAEMKIFLSDFMLRRRDKENFSASAGRFSAPALRSVRHNQSAKKTSIPAFPLTTLLNFFHFCQIYCRNMPNHVLYFFEK